MNKKITLMMLLLMTATIGAYAWKSHTNLTHPGKVF